MAEVQQFSTLTAMLDEATRRHPANPLFGRRTPTGHWAWTSYRQFASMVEDCCHGLALRGVKRGERVAVVSNNRLEWAVVAHACYRLGAALVPMYESQREDEWAYILKDSSSVMCFVSNRAVFDRVSVLQHRCPALTAVVAFDEAPSTSASFAALLEHGAEGRAPRTHVNPHDIATIIYTSGTTGAPKGVRLSHGNLASNVSAILAITPLGQGERSLGFLPWAHVYGGCLEMHTAIATGGAIAICEDPTKLLDHLREVAPTILFAVPRIWNRIYAGVTSNMAKQPSWIQSAFRLALSARSKQRRGARPSVMEQAALAFASRVLFPKIAAQLGGKLRFAFSGAAALSIEVGEFIDGLGIEVYEGYGMTETAGVIASNRPGAKRMGSVGQPAPGVSVVIERAGSELAPGEGEIVVFGPGVMAGYHGLEDATRDTLTAGGGLRTGDLGRFDDDGYLFITGRVKELFKLSNGKYVAPAAIEEKLQLSPYIAQCMLYGDNQPHPVALIVVEAETLNAWAEVHGLSTRGAALLKEPHVQKLYEAEITRQIGGAKGYERVRDFLLEADPFSTANNMLTPTLKLKRREILKVYEGRLRALYARAQAAADTTRAETSAQPVRAAGPAV